MDLKVTKDGNSVTADVRIGYKHAKISIIYFIFWYLYLQRLQCDPAKTSHPSNLWTREKNWKTLRLVDFY